MHNSEQGHLEYITIEEACQVTGLAEKTLKERLRGRVVQYGHNAWNREQFFDFFKTEWEQKRQRIEDNIRTRAVQHANGY